VTQISKTIHIISVHITHWQWR